MKTLFKYLDTHSEPEIPRGLYRQTFFPKPNERYTHCAVIPLYGEATLWLEQGLSSLLTAAKQVSGKTLLIAVVNRHEQSEPWVREENEQILEFFKSFNLYRCPDFPQITLHEISSEVDLLCLDHNEEPHLFSSKEGVGKARKLGCDLALALTTTPILSCRYIHTTDGDALVAPDYFQIEQESNASVLLHPYTHVGNYQQMEALVLYEKSLRYYVAGLALARSPYAHESLGSTIAITPECYAAVRGFPKRNAAEDFYLLNKAVKVGSLEQSKRGLVTLIGRESNRVPFGTGVGTQKFHQKMVNQQPITFYHPDSFIILGNLISALERWSESSDSAINKTEITQWIQGEVVLTNTETLTELLDQLSFFEILKTAKHQRTSPSSILKHCHESWDGFKTLKFIHGLRDKLLGEIESDRIIL